MAYVADFIAFVCVCVSITWLIGVLAYILRNCWRAIRKPLDF